MCEYGDLYRHLLLVVSICLSSCKQKRFDFRTVWDTVPPASQDLASLRHACHISLRRSQKQIGLGQDPRCPAEKGQSQGYWRCSDVLALRGPAIIGSNVLFVEEELCGSGLVHFKFLAFVKPHRGRQSHSTCDCSICS